MDTLKEDIYDLVGYDTENQKQDLQKIIYDIFINLLEECMRRNDKNIVIEYPFNENS